MSTQFDLILRQAIQAFQTGNTDRASSILKRAINIEPNNAHALHIFGLVLVVQNNLRGAIDLLSKAVRLSPNDGSIQYNLAKALSDSGAHEASISHHKKATELDPNNPKAWLNWGKAEYELQKYSDAINLFSKAFSINPNYAEAVLNIGLALKELYRYEDALEAINKAISININLAEAWSGKGVTLNELKNYEEALACFDRALEIKPSNGEAWHDKAITLHALKQYEEALACFDRALEIKPDNLEFWNSKAITLQRIQKYEEAIACLDRALLDRLENDGSITLKGAVQVELKQYEEALASFDRAIEINPNNYEAWHSKAITLHKLKQYEEALACFDRALEIKPDNHEIWNNKSITLQVIKQYESAIASLDKALGKKPIDWSYGSLVQAKMKICDFNGMDELIQKIIKKVFQKEKTVVPFVALSISDDAYFHQQCAEIYAQNMFPINSSLGEILKINKNEKIRIAYFSPDFRHHAVSYLTAELFEIHDRNKFEVFAFSLQKAPDGDEVYERLKRGFDKFINVERMSDQEVAKLSRDLQIDIAIDLAGLTQDSGTKIFTYRAAPIQVNWLGYPGTIGSECMDYIVADSIVIPDHHHHFYIEKVVKLPNCYMVDDSKRIPSEKIYTKEECGLPENKFVFCCFNNDYKINQKIVDSWSRILLKVEESILWISENNSSFKINIIKEFEKRGIKSSRIFFAQKETLMGDYLAKIKIADLFLDTHIYNAHTTGMDALKASLPILTLMGESFASRVAASLLNSIGLPELITKSQKEYEDLAIELATNQEKFRKIKAKLISNRSTKPLFNTLLFTQKLEDSYIKMYERYRMNLSPDNLIID